MYGFKSFHASFSFPFMFTLCLTTHSAGYYFPNPQFGNVQTSQFRQSPPSPSWLISDNVISLICHQSWQKQIKDGILCIHNTSRKPKDRYLPAVFLIIGNQHHSSRKYWCTVGYDAVPVALIAPGVLSSGSTLIPPLQTTIFGSLFDKFQDVGCYLFHIVTRFCLTDDL